MDGCESLAVPDFLMGDNTATLLKMGRYYSTTMCQYWYNTQYTIYPCLTVHVTCNGPMKQSDSLHAALLGLLASVTPGVAPLALIAPVTVTH